MARLTVIGSGNAFSQDGRGNAAWLFERDRGGPFLVDVGPTAIKDWPALVPRTALAGVLITHLHGDHTAGWPFLLLDLRLRQRRAEPLPVAGPVGTAAALEALASACYGELSGPEACPTPVTEWPVEAGSGRTAPFDLSVDCVPMRHHRTSLGYRFEVDGRKVALTGDTAWCDGLETLARGADVLVLECTDVEDAGPSHVSLNELRARRRDLDVERIVLVHLNDAVAQSLALDPLEGVEASWDGRVFDL